jgi:hypothetical protein
MASRVLSMGRDVEKRSTCEERKCQAFGRGADLAYEAELLLGTLQLAAEEQIVAGKTASARHVQ